QGQPRVPAARRRHARGPAVRRPVPPRAEPRGAGAARRRPRRHREEACSVKEILADVERFRARGEKVAIATVVATRRSAPRPIGSKLAISESGELAGSVSGGCVESDVYENAQEVLRTGRPVLLTYGIEDELAWSVGLPCGGEIDVFVERFEGELPEEPSVTLTVLEGERIGQRRRAVDGEVPPGPSRVAELGGEPVFAGSLG